MVGNSEFPIHQVDVRLDAAEPIVNSIQERAGVFVVIVGMRPLVNRLMCRLLRLPVANSDPNEDKKQRDRKLNGFHFRSRQNEVLRFASQF